MTPAEIKFALAQRLHQMAGDGPLPQIVGLHSVHIEGDTVSVGYDLAPSGEILFFEFELPALISRDELADFGRWLAWSSHGETVH